MSGYELVDLVDDNGSIVRTAVPRIEAESLNGDDVHIPIIGCVILNSMGEVLVHERAEGKRFAGCIDNVYGAINSGETPEEAAERECEEELGIKINTINRVREGINDYNYYQYLFAVTTDDQAQKFSLREVSWAGYLTPDQLRANQVSDKYKFTLNFFTDLDAALTKINN